MRAFKSITASIAAAGLVVAGATIALAAPSPSPTESPTVAATPNAAGTCSASQVLSSPSLGKFYGYVIDVTSGKVLLNLRGEEATPSASVLKVLSVSAALANVASNYVARTTVLGVPSEPGTIVLRGGGDHTLSNMTKDSYTTYVKPARLERLANQVLLAYTGTTDIKKIILDDSLFSGAGYNPFWKASDRTNGYISSITALQVDSDRANPDLTSNSYSGTRSLDPVSRTGKLFRDALGALAKGAKLVVGKTPSNAVELTSVTSQPISTWMAHAIGISDNTETEFIGRHAAIAAGLPGSFESIEPMVKRMLAKYNIDASNLVMKDASGLAQDNRVTAKMIAELMAIVARGDSVLAPLETYLPVAGVGPGSLGGRFTGANAVARKFVKGKTGYIPGLYSLAGIINASDGSRLAYAIFARSADGQKVGWATRGSLDTVATKFYKCGAGLTL